MRNYKMQTAHRSRTVAEALRRPLRWALALGFAVLVAIGGAASFAQQRQPTPAVTPTQPQLKGQAFPTPEAAFAGGRLAVARREALTPFAGVVPYACLFLRRSRLP